MKRFCEWRM